MSFSEILGFLSERWYLAVIPLFVLSIYGLLLYACSLKEKERALSKRANGLNQWASQLDNLESGLQKKSAELARQSAAVALERQRLNDLVRTRTIELCRHVATRDYLRYTPAYRAVFDLHSNHLHTVLNSSMSVASPFDISAAIRSDSGEAYATTLYSCTCPDFMYRKQPCKHMLRLALELGLLLSVDTAPLQQEVRDLLNQREALLQESQQISNRMALLEKRQKDSESLLQEKQLMIQQKEQDLQQLLQEKQQSFPWLAKLFADRCSAYDDQIIAYLKKKDRAAPATAARIENGVKQELRTWRVRAKQCEYQLHFYETLFPWLTEFKEVPPAEAFQYTQNAQTAQVEDRELFRAYLSPEEYQTLSDTERSQLALERYIRRKKSPWEVGVDYERYIGFLCEQEGYAVTYFGATAEKADMGRDLILEKGETIVLIQCKRWAHEKRIHENHIFQLAGSTYAYQYAHPDKKVIGVFVTTISFSPVAVRCAELLKIRLFPNVPFREYPRIKCNIRKAEHGEIQKIYHLPMDQQYDRVKISHPGECYALSVSEAESLGFRRAHRWNSSDRSGGDSHAPGTA